MPARHTLEFKLFTEIELTEYAEELADSTAENFQLAVDIEGRNERAMRLSHEDIRGVVLTTGGLTVPLTALDVAGAFAFIRWYGRLVECPSCKSGSVTLFTTRHSARSKVKRFQCKKCKRTFSELSGTPLQSRTVNVAKAIMIRQLRFRLRQTFASIAATVGLSTSTVAHLCTSALLQPGAPTSQGQTGRSSEVSLNDLFQVADPQLIIRLSVPAAWEDRPDIEKLALILTREDPESRKPTPKPKALHKTQNPSRPSNDQDPIEAALKILEHSAGDEEGFI